MNLEKELRALIKNIEGDSGDFPSVAARALESWKLQRSVNEEEVLRLALKCDLPKQWYGESGFGHFNVTLYRKDFIVQIYLMRSMPTEIHDHPFHGAFKSLAGSNLHTQFSFEETSQITNWVTRGELSSEKTQVLQEGDVALLEEGGIHQVHRLGENSITVLVSKDLNQENYYYLYPRLKIKNRPNNLRSQTISRKIMALRQLFELSSDQFEEEAQSLLNELELDEVLSVGTRLGGSAYRFTAQGEGRSFATSFLKVLEKYLKETEILGNLRDHSTYLRRSQKKAGLLKV